jgi:hypothetical protein
VSPLIAVESASLNTPGPVPRASPTVISGQLTRSAQPPVQFGLPTTFVIVPTTPPWETEPPAPGLISATAVNGLTALNANRVSATCR